jgi:hypothetical protein
MAALTSKEDRIQQLQRSNQEILSQNRKLKEQNSELRDQILDDAQARGLEKHNCERMAAVGCRLISVLERLKEENVSMGESLREDIEIALRAGYAVKAFPDSSPQQLFLVWNEGDIVGSKTCSSLDYAKDCAARLAEQNPGRRFYVLGALGNSLMEPSRAKWARGDGRFDDAEEIPF